MDQIEPLLIIITGPVGAGKSSMAIALAQALRQRGRPTAVIDLDEVYRFVSQQDGYADATGGSARAGAAGLANAFFDSEIDVVIVEGEFFNAAELETVVARVDVGVRTLFYTLSGSYEQCGGRTAGLSPWLKPSTFPPPPTFVILNLLPFRRNREQRRITSMDLPTL